MPSTSVQRLITYSDKYADDHFEYRHVLLPPELRKQVPKFHLMTESEWRNLGVQQSPGWVHYMIHNPDTKAVSRATEIVKCAVAIRYICNSHGRDDVTPLRIPIHYTL